MQFEDFTEIPLDIGSLHDRHWHGPMGNVLNFALAYLFIESPFARRIKNALELAAHADGIANRAVALSLCVSALEAMLCSRDKKEKNSDQLKKRIPALLQADDRLTKDSHEAIRALYKVRNRCVHGEDLSTLAEVDAVRRLLAAVLRATLEWAGHQGAPPAQTKETEWIIDLQAASGGAGIVFGVSKDLIEHLEAFTNIFRKDRLKELFEDGDEE